MAKADRSYKFKFQRVPIMALPGCKGASAAQCLHPAGDPPSNWRPGAEKHLMLTRNHGDGLVKVKVKTDCGNFGELLRPWL